MNNFFKIYSCLTLSALAIVLLILAFWAFYPYNPIVFHTNYVSTTKLVYHQGDVIFYNLDYCKYTNIQPVISRVFEDTVIYTTVDIKGTKTQGCYNFNASISVPNIPSGTYRLKLIYTYQVNPLKEIVIIKYTNLFQIIE